MSRTWKAVVASIVFIIVYIGFVITIPDHFGRINWMLEAIYWCIVGTVWVFPIRWLMLWSVHQR